MYYLDIDNWNRREHFHFFKTFSEPFFGICAEVDVTEGYHAAKEHGYSFFLYYLHKTLVAANAIESFHYRMSPDGQVEVHERIDVSPTVFRPDGTFGFSYFEYYPDFEAFAASAQRTIDKVRAGSGLFSDNTERINVLHCSALPWVRFSAMSHARQLGSSDSVPKISYGKTHWQGERLLMPVSVHAHHALMDGYHAAQWYERFEAAMHETG